MVFWQLTPSRRWCRRRGIPTTVCLAVAAIVLAACANSPAATEPSVDVSTPLAAAQSWFESINSKDLSAAQEDFIPSARSMMDWGGGDTSTWSTFTKVHCKTLQESGRSANIYCSFNESPSSSEGNPDSFWTISMQRNGGRWLIDNYGQG
jgi:hypothetical protein